MRESVRADVSSYSGEAVISSNVLNALLRERLQSLVVQFHQSHLPLVVQPPQLLGNYMASYGRSEGFAACICLKCASKVSSSKPGLFVATELEFT